MNLPPAIEQDLGELCRRLRKLGYVLVDGQVKGDDYVLRFEHGATLTIAKQAGLFSLEGLSRATLEPLGLWFGIPDANEFSVKVLQLVG
jgi:hypothetical protein